MIKILNAADAGFDQELEILLHRDTPALQDVTQQTQAIIDDVRKNGDAAVIRYTAKFDRLNVSAMAECKLDKAQLKAAADSIDAGQRKALETAIERVKKYHQAQLNHGLNQGWSYTQEDGTVLGQKIVPLDKVGIYVPGGKAAYPSSVIMSAVTAKVAGVKEIIMVVPTPGGEVNNFVLAATYLSGVDQVFTIGGAQAVAALAYGTESIPRVDKIVGPGNIYVATAKKLVFGQVGIDMIAGPSEVLVVCDDSVDADWVAMDMFAQAEHDELAQSVVLTDDAAMAEKIQAAVEKLLPQMPRREIIEKSLRAHGAIILCQTEQRADICNAIAPEHLQLMTRDAEALNAQIHHAGAVFIGQYSAESLGDYCAGPNHVLPTSGTARFSSPLGVYDFLKRSSVIQFTQRGAAEISETAGLLADMEGLSAHAASARYRNH